MFGLCDEPMVAFRQLTHEVRKQKLSCRHSTVLHPSCLPPGRRRRERGEERGECRRQSLPLVSSHDELAAAVPAHHASPAQSSPPVRSDPATSKTAEEGACTYEELSLSLSLSLVAPEKGLSRDGLTLLATLNHGTCCPR